MTDPNHEIPRHVSGDQLLEEILNLIHRYGQESDITWHQVIGALEVAKHRCIEQMDENSKDDSE